MSKVQFEVFLASQFCDFFLNMDTSDSKFHFICPDESQALKLYNGFKQLGVRDINIDDSIISYVTVNDRHILIMLHNENEKNQDTFHEDFIATVRDKINIMDNFSLLVIHNSTLDTILSTCKDLASDGSVFTNSYIEEKLLELAKKSKYSHLAQVLVERRKSLIEAENRNIFGFSKLYVALCDDDISMIDEGLFDDPRLKDSSNLSEIKGSIKDNENIYIKIDHSVSDYYESPSDLKNSLEELNFSENFIQEHFPSNDLEKWRELRYSDVEAEVDKNKERSLELISIELNDSIVELWKKLSDKGANNKHISALLEVSPETQFVELKIKFSRGEPALRKDEVKIKGDINGPIHISTSNHERHSILNCKFSYDNKPQFIYISLQRNKSKEQFKFNCLLIEKSIFNLANKFQNLSIKANDKNKAILLESGDGELIIDDTKNIEYHIKYSDEEINAEELYKINFKNIIEQQQELQFQLIFGPHRLPIRIIETQAIEKLTIPGILDPFRTYSIEQSEKIPQYKPISRKAIVSGRERGLDVESAILCDVEYKYIEKKLLYEDKNKLTSIYIEDLFHLHPRLHDLYSSLYGWLEDNKTILSLTNWPLTLTSIVSEIMEEYLNYFKNISEGAINEQDKILLKVGLYKKDEKEWMMPHHPLCLAYSLQLLDNRRLDRQDTFKDLEKVTLDRLNPAGLLPIVYEPVNGYAYSIPHKYNKLWIEWVSQQQNSHSYVSKLVLEKIEDFTRCFNMLFEESPNAPLLINSINNQCNTEVFNGIVDYFKKYKDKARKIHVNIYDEIFFRTKFDIFSQEDNFIKARELIKSNGQNSIDFFDQIISLLRNKVSYSKFIVEKKHEYAHLSFFRNNQEVKLCYASISNAKSGISCDGLISGEASYLDHQTYYTGFGLKNILESNSLIQLAAFYNQLLIPARNDKTQYIKNSVPVLAVSESFKRELHKSYQSSLWTCIIDPKVTLDFFDDKETILIHYSDQYTSSATYDAITVTSKVALYKALLNSDSDELINSFNAINGQWLLSIVKEAGKPKHSNTEKQLKEKHGIVAAYKFLSALLSKSGFPWIPLSTSEMLRVAKNTGLSIKDSHFSAQSVGHKGGPISDDILFVGIIDNSIAILPLEVKSREKGNDFSKAINQVQTIDKLMKKILSPRTLKGQLLRGLFIQQVFTQIDKYQLYKVFPYGYFSHATRQRELLMQGHYRIVDIDKYPLGVAIALNNSVASSRIECNLDHESNIVTIQLPMGIMEKLQTSSINEWSEKLIDNGFYPSLTRYVLKSPNFIDVETLSDNFIEKPLKSRELEQDKSDIEVTSVSPLIANFMYPEKFEVLIEFLLHYFNQDLNISDIESLSEDDFRTLIKSDDDTLLIDFLRLQLWLGQKDQSDNGLSDNNNNNQLLSEINIAPEFSALVQYLIKNVDPLLTLGKLNKLTDTELLQLKGFGNAKLEKLHTLRNMLNDSSFSWSTLTVSSDSFLIQDLNLSLDILEQKLYDSLDGYLLTEQKRRKDIFSTRLGIDCQSATLEEIGIQLGVTRERVRQIENQAKTHFKSQLTVAQQTIWAIVKANLSQLRSPLFPKLQARFSSLRSFYTFLELCCGLEENEIRKIIEPNLNVSIFYSYWVWNESPGDIDDFIWYLHENLNIELATAENQLVLWKEKGILSIESNKIYPLSLPKVEALTNSLLDFPLEQGCHWRELQKYTINKKTCLADICQDRLDPAIMLGTDKDFLYQTNSGTYRHVKYLELSPVEKEQALSSVKNKLEHFKYQNRESVNLRIDIFEQDNFAFDYYILRYIVRNYGEREGIFFSGKSNAETVSLDSNFSLISQRVAIEELFRNALEPLDKSFIASKIRSESISHAAFYIDQLLTDGVIVRISETKYAHVDNAFKDTNIEKVIKIATDFIYKESRIIEGEQLQTYINSLLDLENNKYFYLSLLKVFSEKYEYKFYFVQNLVSQKPIAVDSLTDICREALLDADNTEDIVEKIKRVVLASDVIIKRALGQIKNSVRTKVITQNPSQAVIQDGGDLLIYENSVEKAIIENDVSSCRVLLGKAIDTQDEIYWEYGSPELANRHMIIFGSSGQGKTYCIQGLLMELARAHYNSLVIDYTNGFLPNQLENEFEHFVKPKSYFLAKHPISISPFRKQKQDLGSFEIVEANHVVAARVASVFNKVYSSIGEQQLPTLINVIEDGVRLYGEQFDFTKMFNALQSEGKTGEMLANKISSLIKSNLFDYKEGEGWKSLFKNKKELSSIIQLASLPNEISRLAIEFILWDLYSYANSNGNKNEPLPIVLDEVQNLDHSLGSPLGKMLTEGRKFGLSLILATQTLSVLTKEEQDRLFQAAHKLFFAPAETEAGRYAALLEQIVPGSSKKDWIYELMGLQKGECISVGLYKDKNGSLVPQAITIKILALNLRDK